MNKQKLIDSLTAAQLYLRDISYQPLLSVKEEKILTAKAKQGDFEAKKQLIEKNLRLVVYIAKRYRNFMVDFLDLIEEGNMGLIKAVDRFDPALGFRFATYAVWWIRQSIEASIQNCYLIKLPEKMRKSLKDYQKVVEALTEKLKRTPMISEIAKNMGKTRSEVEEIIRYSSIELNTLSLDFTLQEEGKDSYLSCLKDEQNRDPSEEIHLESLITIIDQWLDCLKPDQCEVIARRFGLRNYEKSTIAEISKIMLLPIVKIRQLQDSGLRFLRHLAVDTELIDG